MGTSPKSMSLQSLEVFSQKLSELTNHPDPTKTKKIS